MLWPGAWTEFAFSWAFPAFLFGIHQMTKIKTGGGPAPAASMTGDERKIFLSHLAQSANVSASAREANVHSVTVYRERQRNAAFRTKWEAALAEGYVRLETELLGEALIPASGNVKDATLKARAQKYRLGMGLLASHRAAVRGEAAPEAKTKTKGQSTARLRIEARFVQMRKRAGEA
jgi:hypothetical protein